MLTYKGKIIPTWFTFATLTLMAALAALVALLFWID